MSVPTIGSSSRQLQASTRKSTGRLNDLQPSSKRDSETLPWQEESVTRNREAGKSLIMLQKQNASLRAELSKLNEQLNDIIYETQRRKVALKFMPQADMSPQELANAQKRLEVYSKEYDKVKARYTLLLEPSYEMKLQQNIYEQEGKVMELEAWLRNAGLLKAKREKVLDSVLETGETPEMQKAIGDALSEFKVATSKNMRLERLVEIDQNGYIENIKKSQALKGKIEKIQAKLASLPPDPDKSLVKRIEEASRGKAGAEKQLYNVGAKMNVKLTAAQKRLASLQEQEKALVDQLNQKAEALGGCLADLNSLQETALPSKKSSKKAIGSLPKMPNSKNLFLTENQYSDKDREYADDEFDY